MGWWDYSADGVCDNRWADYPPAKRMGLPADRQYIVHYLVRVNHTQSKPSLYNISISIDRTMGGGFGRGMDSRVVVMTIDINFTNTCPRSVVSTRPSIIANHRNNNTSVPSLVNHILEVLAIGEGRPTATTGVFIIRLIQDHRATVRDLSLCNGGSNMGDVAGYRN